MEGGSQREKGINSERETGLDVEVRGKRSERTHRVMAPKGAVC